MNVTTLLPTVVGTTALHAEPLSIAVPLPPRLLTQVIDVTPTLSLALPVTVTVPSAAIVPTFDTATIGEVVSGGGGGGGGGVTGVTLVSLICTLTDAVLFFRLTVKVSVPSVVKSFLNTITKLA